MPQRAPIDALPYLRMFPADVPTTLALIIRLIQAAPHSADPADEELLRRVRPSAEAMREGGVHLQHVWKIREEASTTKLRPFDIEWDVAWGALLERLEPWSIFAQVRRHADASKKAEELITLLFANRLDFTRLELNAQWVEGRKRHEWIAEKNLRDDLVALAGAPFVERVEETHEALGRALGLVGGRPDADLPLVVDLAGAKRAAHEAILAYMLQLIAADALASDALSQSMRGSFAVMDAFRARARANRSTSDGEGEAGDTDTDSDTQTDPVDPGDAPDVGPDTPIPPLP